MCTRKLLAAALCAATLFVYSAPAVAEIASNVLTLTRNKDTAVALSSADPSGTANGTGGYSVDATIAAGYATGFWCEVDAGANNITGGNVRVWELPATGAAWARVPDADYIGIQSATVKPPWMGSLRKGVFGVGARIYCQLENVTLSAGTTVDKYTGVKREKR